MKRACIGISRFFEQVKQSDIWENLGISILFDNDSSKWGGKAGDLYVEQPRYIEDVFVYITVGEKFHLEMIRQLLDMGYRQFALVLKQKSGEFIIRSFDYNDKDYNLDKRTLILLFLEKRSFAGICAIEWMQNHALIDMHGFQTKIFKNNIEDVDYYYDIVTARYLITEMTMPWNGEWSWIWFNSDSIKVKLVQMWHGFPLKTMGKAMNQYDETEKNYIENMIHEEWNQYHMILSYGCNYMIAMSACYGTRANQYKVTGLTRNDLLFYTDGRKLLEERFPDCRGKNVVLYMPTFRESTYRERDGSDSGYIFYWNDFDNTMFVDFCEKNDIYVVFKLHPSDESRVKEWCRNSDNIGVLTEALMGDNCMYEFLNGTDMLITDYSSIYFDYMLLDRPIIFTNQDEEEYLANRGMLFEPLDFWRPGPIVNTMEDLQSEIVKVLNGEDSHHEQRKQLTPFVHKYTDGNSTQRLFDLLKEDSEKTDEE